MYLNKIEVNWRKSLLDSSKLSKRCLVGIWSAVTGIPNALVMSPTANSSSSSSFFEAGGVWSFRAVEWMLFWREENMSSIKFWMYNVVISFSRTKCVAFGNSHDKLWSSQWNITEKKNQSTRQLVCLPSGRINSNE